jgi:hypothetical protein
MNDQQIINRTEPQRNYRDHRDMVIEMLADAEAELLARVRDLTSDRDTYREMSLAALDQLAIAIEKNRALTRSVRQATQELRRIHGERTARRGLAA